MTVPPVIIIATRNLHKVEEIRAVMAEPCREQHFIGLSQLPGCPEIVEDADSFRGNAIKKAIGIAGWIAGEGKRHLKQGGGSLWAVLADDSGLEVDALNGAPGVHSARFAALENTLPQKNSSDAENNAKLLRLLRDVPEFKRTARFRCVIAWVSTGSPPALSEPQLFEGRCEGRIALEPSGAGGFGYDPLFFPQGENRSFAELGTEVKNRMSHRAQALAELCRAFARD